MSSVALESGSISVALCTWNGEAHLQAQLDSLLAQTLLPAELVVCDDGSGMPGSAHSGDSTLAILNKFAQIAPFPVRIVRNATNLGSTRNFEQAISLCRGEFIALCDQDDIWLPNKLATLSSIMTTNPDAGGVFSDGKLLDPNGQITERTLWQSIRFGAKDQQLFSTGKFAEVLLRRNVVTGMTLFFRTSLRNQLLPIPESWVHDAWLAWTIALNSRLIACPEALVAYRVHTSQQLGVPMSPAGKLVWVATNGLNGYFKQARLKSLADYQQAAQQYTDLCTYLERSDIPNKGTVLAKLRDKASFAKTSAGAVTASRLRRLAHLARHASSYLAYTQLPLRSAVRDLLL